MHRKIAIFPASFDPPTNGHVDLVDRLIKLSIFDEIIIAIGANRTKSTRFTLDERIEMLSSIFSKYPSVKVEAYSGLTAEYAKLRGASTIIRGLRVFSDFEYEFQMARMNRQLAPEVDILFMMANLQYAHLSSTLIMEIAELSSPEERSEKLAEMVPQAVINMIEQYKK